MRNCEVLKRNKLRRVEESTEMSNTGDARKEQTIYRSHRNGHTKLTNSRSHPARCERREAQFSAQHILLNNPLSQQKENDTNFPTTSENSLIATNTNQLIKNCIYTYVLFSVLIQYNIPRVEAYILKEWLCIETIPGLLIDYYVYFLKPLHQETLISLSQAYVIQELDFYKQMKAITFFIVISIKLHFQLA